MKKIILKTANDSDIAVYEMNNLEIDYHKEKKEFSIFGESQNTLKVKDCIVLSCVIDSCHIESSLNMT